MISRTPTFAEWPYQMVRLACDHWTNGVREGCSAVRALGLTVTPLALSVLFTWLPKSFAVYYWRRFFRAEMADYVFGRHARAASREMREIANDCRAMLEKTGIEAPALQRLYDAIDEYAK